MQKVNKEAQTRAHQQAQKTIHHYSKVQATNHADAATQQDPNTPCTPVEKY